MLMKEVLSENNFLRSLIKICALSNIWKFKPWTHTISWNMLCKFKHILSSFLWCILVGNNSSCTTARWAVSLWISPPVKRGEAVSLWFLGYLNVQTGVYHSEVSSGVIFAVVEVRRNCTESVRWPKSVRSRLWGLGQRLLMKSKRAVQRTASASTTSARDALLTHVVLLCILQGFSASVV